MILPRPHSLVIQPYGAALIDGDSGRVDFLNATGAAITKAVLDNHSAETTALLISSEFEVSFDEALKDVNQFISSAPHLSTQKQTHPWHISGSTTNTSVVQADLELTLACQLNCSYCFAEAGKRDLQEIDADNWLLVINWLLEQGLCQATITGGDPLLSKAFWPIAELLADKGICIQLFTNGTRVDSKTVDRLKTIPFNFVQLSLDSIDENVHNRFRGDSHSTAKQAISSLAKAGLPVVIGSSVFPDTLGEIPKLAQFASSIGARLRCSAIDARGRAYYNFSPSNTLNTQLRSDILATVELTALDYPDVFFDLGEQEVTVDDNLHCKFFHGMIAVGSDGRIRPCLESKGFIEQVAPWAVDLRMAWELRSLNDHKAFATVKGINQSFKPRVELCAHCDRFRFCQGCLLAGYSCFHGKEVIQ